MMKRSVCWGIWVFLACLLYFFENNTGTRILLLSTLLLPLLPPLRRGLFGREEREEKAPRAPEKTGLPPLPREEDGDIRAFMPGDPVNRIHWKLSAKRDQLMIREERRSAAPEEAEEELRSGSPGSPVGALRSKGPGSPEEAVRKEDRSEIPEEGSAGKRLPAPAVKKRLLRFCLLLLALSLLLLLVLPAPRLGLLSLLNRVFEASERVNAYAYVRFEVPAGQSELPALILLSLALLSALGLACLSAGPLPALGLMGLQVLLQVYFGLSFPAWLNVALFALFLLRMLRRPRLRQVLPALAGILVISLLVVLLRPGVTPEVEAASESVRDRLSSAFQHLTGGIRELPESPAETRHVHTRSLITGEEDITPDRTYRLLTVEEEMISMPRWVDYLRIILLLAATGLAVFLPFLPFVLINRRRRKALEARAVFRIGDAAGAVCAIFQHVAAWLEAADCGGGNLPYALWQPELSPDYDARFAECAKLFEEAAYSTHEITESQRQQALSLLEETEKILKQRADRKLRFRLKYREWLWI